MAGLFDKQADLYLDARPNYPSEWYSMLAAQTPHHRLAWDVGTGNGQAALGVAEYFDKVIATDITEAQLKLAMPHPKVHYHHTPPSISDDEIISLIGGENSLDLITVAQAIHWFDLPKFYYLANRLLRKPNGIIAVWGYNNIEVSPTFDTIMKKFHDTTLPYWHPNTQHLFDGYKTLPFPFESEGPAGPIMELDIPKELSFKGFVRMVGSWSAVVTAKEQGMDLLNEEMVKRLETAWGGSGLVKSVVYKAFMLVGKVKM
jgi:SAM-dependent methyltransferase